MRDPEKFPLLDLILCGHRFWDIDSPPDQQREVLTKLQQQLKAEHELLLELEPTDEFHACVLMGVLNLVEGLLSCHESARPSCPHGNHVGACSACDVQGDLAYDAAREDQHR